MTRHQIICATRRPRTEDSSRHISHVGIGNDEGWSRVMMVEEVIWQLQKPDGDRYFLRGRDGWEAEVKLGRCPYCDDSHEFLVSAPDLMAKDKLLTLPLCGE